MTTAAPPEAPAHAPAHAELRRTPSWRRELRQRFLDPPGWVVLVQLFLGLGWLRAAAEKTIDPAWWSGQTIRDFVADHDDVTLPWMQPFLESVVLPRSSTVGLVVLITQVLVGCVLLVDRRTGWALAAGATMNLAFVTVGAVDPSAFYLLAQAALGLWILEYRQRADRAVTALQTLVMAGAGLAAASAPAIRTVAPADVITDPAVMLTFFGLLTAFAAQLSASRWRLRLGHPAQPRPQADARR